MAGNPARFLRKLRGEVDEISGNPEYLSLTWLLPPRAQKELTAVFEQALETAGFIGGPMLEDFERDFRHSAKPSMRWCG